MAFKPLLLSLVLDGIPLASGIVPCPNTSSHPWCDPSVNSNDRVDRLLGALADEELPALLSDDLFGGAAAVERLDLPKYMWISEADHGLLKVGIKPLPTSFPQVGILAASFNRSLFRAIGSATGREAKALAKLGLQDGLLLHNNINIFRDPRWGRGQETPGEDPFLSAAYATEWVQGVQQLDSNGRMLAAAACKHFVAYSLEGVTPHTRHSFDANVTTQDLADTYLPAFEACVKARAKGLMCSYNAVNGTPSCANEKLLTEVLRKKWGFDGVVVTDCDAVADLAPHSNYDSHPFAKNRDDAVLAAISAGVDVDCGMTFKDNATLVPTDLLRRAARRTLKVRFELGEFDPPQRDGNGETAWQDHKGLAHEAVLQGAVLLKNDIHTLPLKKGIRLALFGNLANASAGLLGDYSSSPVDVATILGGLQQYVKSLHFENGTDDICSDRCKKLDKPDADAVVVALGLKGEDQSFPNPDIRSTIAECEASCLEAEGCDRRTLHLPRGQQHLIEQVSSWKLPLVLLVASGGPVDLSTYAVDPDVHSMLWVGYPGQEAGPALASLLFGDESPSGRLPLTFYNSAYADAVPIESMAMRPAAAQPGRTYRFVTDDFVLYPFGHGLTYDTWQLSWLDRTPRPSESPLDQRSCKLRVNAAVTSSPNTAGNYIPTLSLLLFVRPPVSAHASAPVKELRGFERVRLAAGEQSGEVDFELQLRDFLLADAGGNWHLQPGRWTIEIGSQPALRRQVDVSADGCSIVQFSAHETIVV
eukprot:TRINITY_DN121033_c0_g1_i1.p1 TRINITY_DN121033_c0_g1~~TRINITY_DN121033_c0_g1_i1.p1  ORF type:complete len:760 (-),score=89.65 TRINITY_DN121033_c0_g1_i1:106-2385(-)